MGKMESFDVTDGNRGEAIQSEKVEPSMMRASFGMAMNFGRGGSVVTEFNSPLEGEWSVVVHKTIGDGLVFKYVLSGPAHEFSDREVIGLILHQVSERCTKVRPPGRR